MFDYINTIYENAEIVIRDNKTASEAITLIKRKINENGKSAELLCYLSKAYIFTDKPKLALKYAKEACKIDPDYNYAKARVIFAYYKLNKQKQVLSLIDKLLKCKNLDSFSAFLCLMSLVYLKGERIKELSEIINKDKTPPVNKCDYEIRIITALYDNNFDTGKKLIQKAEEQKYIDTRLYSHISYFYFIEKDYEKSLEYADKGIALNDKDNYVYYIKGTALRALNRKEEALSYLLKAEEYGCTYDYLFQVIADVYLFIHDKKNAIKYINKAIKSAPDNAFNYKAKGIILYAFDKEKEALKYLKKAENMGYSSCDIFSKLSYLYFNKKNYKKSLEYANKAILKDSNDEYSYYRKGFALYRLEEYEKAEKPFLKAEELGCDVDDMYSRLSYIYSKKDNYKKSLEYANKAILLNNEDFYAHYRKGYALMAFEKAEEAEISFLKAEELGCSYADMYFEISISKYIKNDFETALKYIDKALLKKNKADYLYFKAQILSSLGKEFEAQKYYKKALKTDKDI